MDPRQWIQLVNALDLARRDCGVEEGVIDYRVALGAFVSATGSGGDLVEKLLTFADELLGPSRVTGFRRRLRLVALAYRQARRAGDDHLQTGDDWPKFTRDLVVLLDEDLAERKSSRKRAKAR